MKKKVMLYLDEPEYNRLKESAAASGQSMNQFAAGLIWNHDAATRKTGELGEYKCKRCSKTIWTDTWQAVPPSKCPWCGGELVGCGRWGTLVLGRLR